MERESAPPDESFETPWELALGLGAALEAFDEDGAHDVLDRLLGIYGLERAIRDALMPYLRDLGERWARREVSVAQEHFASRLLEGRLLALARGWNRGPGRRAILACPRASSTHFRSSASDWCCEAGAGATSTWEATAHRAPCRWRRTPSMPDVVVMSAVSNDRFAPIARELTGLARRRPLALAGGGATPELATELDVQCLTDDPATAAEGLARQFVAEEVPRERLGA